VSRIILSPTAEGHNGWSVSQELAIHFEVSARRSRIDGNDCLGWRDRRELREGIVFRVVQFHADVRELQSTFLQNFRGEAFLLAQQAQQKMLGTNVLM
jgi:hypothetical protein